MATELITHCYIFFFYFWWAFVCFFFSHILQYQASDNNKNFPMWQHITWSIYSSLAYRYIVHSSEIKVASQQYLVEMLSKLYCRWVLYLYLISLSNACTGGHTLSFNYAIELDVEKNGINFQNIQIPLVYEKNPSWHLEEE